MTDYLELVLEEALEDVLSGDGGSLPPIPWADRLPMRGGEGLWRGEGDGPWADRSRSDEVLPQVNFWVDGAPGRGGKALRLDEEAESGRTGSGGAGADWRSGGGATAQAVLWADSAPHRGGEALPQVAFWADSAPGQGGEALGWAGDERVRWAGGNSALAVGRRVGGASLLSAPRTDSSPGWGAEALGRSGGVERRESAQALYGALRRGARSLEWVRGRRGGVDTAAVAHSAVKTDPAALDLIFQRDARRYGGGFALY